MEASGPPLPPRHEAFCRNVARGGTLTSAAVEAGYAPASARRRGSELYARDDVQRRIGLLAAERARAEESVREAFIGQLEALFDDCLKHGERGTALRALTLQLQLRGLDAGSVNRRARAERDRQAQEAELRERMRAELRDEIRAGILDELAAVGRESERREPAPERAEAPQTMTKHVGSTNSAGPAPELGSDVLGRALAGLAGGARADAGVLARAGAGAGISGRRGRTARIEDATLPCLDGWAGMPAAGFGRAPGVEARPRG